MNRKYSKTQNPPVKNKNKTDDSYLVDKGQMDLITRKLEFEQQDDDSSHIVDGAENDDNKNMKLKRLFKSRAKKLIERAESLTKDQFDDMMGDYPFSLHNEEEKESKRIDPKIKNVVKLSSPCGSVENFDISINLKDDKNLVAKGSNKHKKVTIEETKDAIDDNKKEDLSDEEFQKFREEKNRNRL